MTIKPPEWVGMIGREIGGTSRRLAVGSVISGPRTLPPNVLANRPARQAPQTLAEMMLHVPQAGPTALAVAGPVEHEVMPHCALFPEG